ncbi:MAG: nitroreductase family protein [Methanothrix sp.]|uniref:nitroreductase family protein n=1 Tax=Methanothrix sp. TaxID=90426 RepID=UPI0025F83BF2|nr:nitroreductase family protein [Methanothrix sp.]MCQ8902968.1 nitroreductase family protein [Methanothrix sp.]
MIELLRSRRSIRRYKAKDIEPEKIEILKEAALRSPTSRGINPWRFFFIRDRRKLGELSRAKESGSSFLRDARLGVVVCARESESDVWIEDCSIASIIMQLTAHSLGLGSCWIQIRNRMHSAHKTSEEYVREVLGLTGDLRVESIIAFGYPDEIKPPVPAEELEYGKITSD